MDTRGVVLTAVLVFACSGGTSEVTRVSVVNRTNQNASQRLDALGLEELNAVLTSGKLADLQWPNFSDRSEAVQAFYTSADHRLGWSRDGVPTPQAGTDELAASYFPSQYG